MRQTSYTLLLLVLITGAAPAEDGPIQVRADRLELDRKKGFTLYQGSVQLQQGDTLLKSERLEVHTKDGKIVLALADGKPVHLEMRDPQTGKITRAEAEHIAYRFDEGKIELRGTAQIWRNGDRFSGERLLYNDHTQQVRAFSDGKNNDRVQVILQPEKETQ